MLETERPGCTWVQTTSSVSARGIKKRLILINVSLTNRPNNPPSVVIMTKLRRPWSGNHQITKCKKHVEDLHFRATIAYGQNTTLMLRRVCRNAHLHPSRSKESPGKLRACLSNCQHSQQRGNFQKLPMKFKINNGLKMVNQHRRCCGCEV